MNTTILLIVALYFIVTLGLGFWVARGEKKQADDYFLAGRKLPWYAVALSMTGANIGSEHFIGMVGTAYAFGLAPATFEWGNFIPYSILLWIFMPYFYRKKLFTIPEFLERRYSQSTRTLFAGLTMSHMVLAVLVPALYAGGLILYEMITHSETTAFNWTYMGCVLLIGGVTAAYSIYGGLLSVVWTDVLQVMILVLGGLLLVGLGIQHVGGIDKVVEINLQADCTRMSLILPADHKVSPWTGVATFWFTLSLWYVGTNQFYIQRCLGARSEWDAKMGVIFCAMIKFFLPFIIVFPGLVAFAAFGPGIAKDRVYLTMMDRFLNSAGQGIIMAALLAAIMSTVSSVLNSASTIWVMDIHKRWLRPQAEDRELVTTGRWSTFLIIVLSTVLAPLLVGNEDGIFIYIQEMAAFFAPSISVIFLCAFLWPKAHSRAANGTLYFGIAIGLVLILLKQLGGQEYTWLSPLLNRAAISWFLCLGAMIVFTYTLAQRTGEAYDRDAIWNLRWAHLPAEERALNKGPRSLMLWWLVMMAVSFGLFAYFR